MWVRLRIHIRVRAVRTSARMRGQVCALTSAAVRKFACTHARMMYMHVHEPHGHTHIDTRPPTYKRTHTHTHA